MRKLNRLLLAAVVAAVGSVAFADGTAETVCECEGAYRWHLQGVCTDGPHLYWTFSDRLVKTDLEGKRLACVPSPMHSGDLCCRKGHVYVAVNRGKFNGDGPADSWVYVYKASDLSFVRKHPVPEVVYGAGGMTAKGDRFYVIGGLPKGCQTNYVYEYASDFRFVKRHDLATGWLNLGIQTVSYENGKFYFGNYGGSGKPANTFACGADLKGPFEFYLPASDYGILTVKGRLCSGEHLKKTDPETGKQACGGRLVPFAAIRLKRDPKTGRWAK